MNTGMSLVLLMSFFATSAWSQQILLSPAESALGEVEAQIANPNSTLSKLGQTVGNVTQSRGFKNKLQEELSKYKVRIKINMFGNVIDSDIDEGGSYYQYVVEPAFRNNEQIRKDIWVLNLRLGSHSNSVGGQVRITFSRFFGGPNAKRDALYAPIQWFWNTPLNTNDIKTKLKDGQGFRLEVAGDIAIGTSESLDGNHLTGRASAHYKRGGLFIMDIFKISPRLARMRFVGMKNRGSLEGNVGIRTPLFSESGGRLSDALSFGFGIKFATAFNFFRDSLTLDTMMTDFLFNFSTEEPLSEATLQQMKNESDVAGNGTAEAAMEHIFSNIKKGGFSSIFLFFDRDKNLYKNLAKQFDFSDKIARQDLADFQQGRLPFKDLRVFNYFRGTILSSHFSTQIYGKLSRLLGANSQSGSVQSYVTSYDENYKSSHFWLDNGFLRNSARSMFGRNKYNMIHDVDVLVYSDANRNFGPLSDVVVRTQIENTKLSARDMQDYKKMMLNSLPDKYKNDPKIHGIFKSNSQTNSYLSYRYSYGEEAFKTIQNIDKMKLATHIMYFLEDHPQRIYMNLPSDTSGDISQIGIGYYAEEKAFAIAAAFDPAASNAQRMKALRSARKDPVVERYLIGEFFPKMLPQENPDPYFGFNLKFSSAESGTSTLEVGNNQASLVYEAVSFMRSIINNQTLDMQMISSDDYTGRQVLVPTNQKGFMAPLVNKPATP